MAWWTTGRKARRNGARVGRLAQVTANNNPFSDQRALKDEDAVSGASEMRDGAAVVLVYATFPDRDAALAVGRDLVEGGLAACINVLAHMTSMYIWDGKLETSNEAVLIAKTPAVLSECAIAAIKAAHSYDQPAIIVLPVTGGDAGYLAWIAAVSKYRSASDPC